MPDAIEAIRRGSLAKKAKQKPAHAPACVDCKLDIPDSHDYARCTVCGSWWFMTCHGQWQRLSDQ